MKPFIYSNIKDNINDTKFEVVETKGKGHPDNICDTLAEKISASYSKYCLENYGVILRHMIDKLSILGGGSKVYFGKGEMTHPIRILINGRFTSKFNGTTIDYMNIVTNTIKEYFKELFPLLDTDKFLTIIDNTHHNEGPGVVYNNEGNTNNERKKFFEAISEEDSKRHNNYNRCNDTSTTVSYYPMSNLEKLVLDIEQKLNSNEYKAKYPYIGNDIKVMGIRKDKNIEITSCVPLIAKYTLNKEDYFNKLEIIKNLINEISINYFPNSKIEIYLNTRDNKETDDYYLTAIGSAVESGDEGAVGRGNRSRGVIPFSRNFSMEAACGKNPVYHTGKLFTVIGDLISKEIYNELGIENTVYCTSKMGDSITNPWNIAVEINQDLTPIIEKKITEIINNNINNHQNITFSIINNENKINSY